MAERAGRIISIGRAARICFLLVEEGEIKEYQKENSKCFLVLSVIKDG